MPKTTMDLNLHAPCILNFPQVNQDEASLVSSNIERKVSRRRPPLDISNGATANEKSSDSRDCVSLRRKKKGYRRRRRRKSCYDRGGSSSKMSYGSTQTLNSEKEDREPATSSMTVASFGEASFSTISLDSTDVLSAWLKRRRRRNRKGDLDSHSAVTGCEPPAFLLPRTHMEKGKLPEDVNFEKKGDASQLDITSATESSTSGQTEDEQVDEDSIQEEHGAADTGVVCNIDKNNSDYQRNEDSSKVVPGEGLDEIDNSESDIDRDENAGKDYNERIDGVDPILGDEGVSKGESIPRDKYTKRLEDKESIDNDNMIVQENRFVEHCCPHDIRWIKHEKNDFKEYISDDNLSSCGENFTETESETSIGGSDDSQGNDSAAIIMDARTNKRNEEEPCVVLEEVKGGLDSFYCPSGELSSSSSQSSASSSSSLTTTSTMDTPSVSSTKHDSTLPTILVTESSDNDITDTSKLRATFDTLLSPILPPSHNSDVREGHTKQSKNLRAPKSRSLVSRGWDEVTYIGNNTELAVVQPEERKLFAKFVIDNHLELRGGFGDTDDATSCSQDDDDRHYRNLLDPSEFVKGKYWVLRCTKTGEFLSTIGVHPSTDSDNNEGGQLALSGFCVPRRWYGEGYGDLLLNTALQHISAGRQQEFGLMILR